MPAPSGPDVVYERYEEDDSLTPGTEGIYTRPSDGPGFGWDLEPQAWTGRNSFQCGRCRSWAPGLFASVRVCRWRRSCCLYRGAAG